MSLWSEFLNNQQRPIHKWIHYFPIYERHFGILRDRAVTFLEIGCGEGGSLQMWKRWLGPRAKIVGLDIREECRVFGEDQITIEIGDQSDPALLQRLHDTYGPFDAILDDGSHIMRHLHASFDHLYPLMPKEGVYMVEDLHTAYWDEYEGGLRRAGSFIERCKGLIDHLNATYVREEIGSEGLPSSGFADETWSMCFYDSIAVFERAPRRLTHAPIIGKAP